MKPRHMAAFSAGALALSVVAVSCGGLAPTADAGTGGGSTATGGGGGSTPSGVTGAFVSGKCGLGTARYALTSGSGTISSVAGQATAADQSVVCAANDGTSVTVTDATITKTGDTSSEDDSSFFGRNAAVLAYGSSDKTTSGGAVRVVGGKITTTAHGGNALFAAGVGATITASDLVIDAAATSAHGVEAASGGSIELTNVSATTTGERSSVLATDRGGGTVTVKGGSFKATGSRSAGIYSTGNITATDATIETTGAEVIVVEGKNIATVTGCTLSSTNDEYHHGMLVYQSFSGDATVGHSTLTMKDGSYAYRSTTGAAILVTNQTTTINMSGVELSNAGPTLLQAAAQEWGTSGSNGGKVTLNATDQTLVGNILVDSVSTVNLVLVKSSLQGAIDAANSGSLVSLSLDGDSSWTVTVDSHLDVLSDAAGISGTSVTNINGGGHTVYYVSAKNTALGGKTYQLSGGGTLTPE